MFLNVASFEIIQLTSAEKTNESMEWDFDL